MLRSSPLCRFCSAADTIRTDQTLACESWYCYKCRRGFDVHHVVPRNTEPEQTRRGPAALREFTSAIRGRLGPSDRR
jgi:hypothetical protein